MLDLSRLNVDECEVSLYPSSNPRHRVAASVQLVVAAWGCGWCFLLAGCGGSPWEQGQSAEVAALEAARKESRLFVADEASIGVWRDERPSGLLIRHGMLIVDSPRMDTAPKGGRSVVVVTSIGPELYDKVAAVVSDRIPVTAGKTNHFALGRAIAITIERVDPDGTRTTLDEGRVAFLELVRR